MQAKHGTSEIKKIGKQKGMTLLGIAMVIPVIVLFLGSCDAIGDFGDMNEHPTNVNEVPPGMQFTRVLQMTTLNQNQELRIARHAGNIVQQIGTTASFGSYSVGDDGYFRSGDGGAYQNRVKLTEDILEQLRRMDAEGEEVDNLLAATRIFRVYIFHQITDLYGDIPYFEAGRGFHDLNFAPKYDPQEEIYDDMFRELSGAVEQFNPSQPTYGSADVMFNGNIDRWQKFANSLRLRLALRLVKVDPQKAETEAVAAIDAPGSVMAGNDDTAYIQKMNRLGMTCCDEYGNRFYYLGVETNFPLSHTFTEWLRARNDPRLSIYAALWTGTNWADGEVISNDPDDLVGRASGWTNFEMQQERHPARIMAEAIAERLDIRNPVDDELLVNAVYARLSPIITPLDGPVIFLSYAQVALMRAEAATWGWIPENAGDHYQAGVRAALEQLAMYDTGNAVPVARIENAGSPMIPPAVIDAYLTEPNVAFPAGGTQAQQLEQINEQYWAASFLDFLEVWANVRRSGYPSLQPLRVDSDNLPSGADYFEPPRRYTWGEDPTNQANLNEARTRQGLTGDRPSDVVVPVWWDVD